MNEPAKILVVDDEDSGRFVKSQTLSRAGFVVIGVSTGGEALARAEHEHPDLIVLDVNLPDISGFEVCRRLRESHAGLPGLQILQISNTAVTNADRIRGLEQGADVYLVEPIDPTVLVATVQSLLRVRRAETALADALGRERHAREAAENASRMKDEFVATLSHELRTPLNALMGWIWQLRHTDLAEDARTRALDSLERNARMQAQLINDLLDVSRASKGKLQLEMRLLDLKTVVTAASEFVREAIDRKGLQLSLKLTPVWVTGDSARLQQIAVNLLTNAVQFTPRGGRITVTLQASGDEALLAVHDTGAGIDEAFLPHVFDQFRQGEGGLSRTHGGLGLGLAVVKQLIDLHDGAVSVESPGVGQGATFTVRLPRETTEPHDLLHARDSLILDGVSVLLISRHADDPEGLRAVLESSGARVTAAAPTDQGSTSGFDVVAVDDDPTNDILLTFPGAAEHNSQSIPRSARVSEIVRRIARTMMTGQTS